MQVYSTVSGGVERLTNTPVAVESVFGGCVQGPMTMSSEAIEGYLQQGIAEGGPKVSAQYCTSNITYLTMLCSMKIKLQQI